MTGLVYEIFNNHPTPPQCLYSHIMLMTEDWLKAINFGNIIGIIMVDFRKAFHLVDHSLLLKNLVFINAAKNLLSHI